MQYNIIMQLQGIGRYFLKVILLLFVTFDQKVIILLLYYFVPKVTGLQLQILWYYYYRISLSQFTKFGYFLYEKTTKTKQNESIYLNNLIQKLPSFDTSH